MIFFSSYQLTPVFASTSLRHNTVDVWEMCAYTEKKKKQGGKICALHILFEYLVSPNI